MNRKYVAHCQVSVELVVIVIVSAFVAPVDGTLPLPTQPVHAY